MRHKDNILKLRSEGKDYDEIVAILGCSKGTVSYHCGEGQKTKHIQRQKRNRVIKHPLLIKIQSFRYIKHRPKTKPKSLSNQRLIVQKIYRFTRRGDQTVPEFTLDDVINKFSETPICYLTGKQLNIYEPRTYQLDHIVPVSRGGDNSLDNLEFCTRKANQSKGDMTHDEYVMFCKTVLEHHGYEVKKLATVESNHERASAHACLTDKSNYQ